MTTVVWHGKSRTLAVDAMGTHSPNGSPILQNEEAYKIVDLVPLNLVTRTGERLLAAAVCGPANSINTVLQFVLEGMGQWGVMAEIVKDLGGTFLSKTTAAGAILITSKAAYRFTMAGGISIKKAELNEFLAIGSGLWMAITAYRGFGVNARDAILAASACDENTGFLIMTVKVTGKGLKEHRGEYVNDLTKELLKIRETVASNQQVDTVKETVSLEKRFGDCEKILPGHRIRRIQDRERFESAQAKKRINEKKSPLSTDVASETAPKARAVGKKKLK